MITRADAEPLCHTCPVCGADDVRLTMSTLTGAYCHCARCGHVWHDDAQVRRSEAVTHESEE